MSRSFQADLKEHLISRAARRTQPNFMKTLLRFTFSFAVIALLLTQVVFPGNSEGSLSSFISEAQAANEDHMDEIYHATIEIEDSSYFETDNFTGWKTTSQVSKEIWISPSKEIRDESTYTSWNGTQEDGSFEEVSDQSSDLLLYDEYGNQLDYTKLEVTGEELTEDPETGDLSMEDTYNVHPAKQHSTEELEAAYQDSIICINTEDGEDFTGYAWAVLHESDPTYLEMFGTAYPKAEPSKIITELEKSLMSGLSSDEALRLFEAVQDDERLSYEVEEADGQTLHHISFNYSDFVGGSMSNSPEGLNDPNPMVIKTTYTFDGETYGLMSVLTERSVNGNVLQRGSYTVTSSEYLPYEENASLFEATEEYTLLSLGTRFEQNISQFEPGCYRMYEKLPREEEAVILSKLEAMLEEGSFSTSKALWERPLQSNFRYYTLPGDDTVHEVK